MGHVSLERSSLPRLLSFFRDYLQTSSYASIESVCYGLYNLLRLRFRKFWSLCLTFSSYSSSSSNLACLFCLNHKSSKRLRSSSLYRPSFTVPTKTRNTCKAKPWKNLGLVINSRRYFQSCIRWVPLEFGLDLFRTSLMFLRICLVPWLDYMFNDW